MYVCVASIQLLQQYFNDYLNDQHFAPPPTSAQHSCPTRPPALPAYTSVRLSWLGLVQQQRVACVALFIDFLCLQQSLMFLFSPPPSADISFLIFSLCIRNFCFTVIFLFPLFYCCFCFLLAVSQKKRKPCNWPTRFRLLLFRPSVCACIRSSPALR